MTIGRRLVGTKALTLSSPQIGTDSLSRVPHQKPILMVHEFLLPEKKGLAPDEMGGDREGV